MTQADGPTAPARGRIVQLSVSPGGVPKLPISAAEVTPLGLAGDDHHDTKHHGGPDAALCLYSAELISALRSEGHPIEPGSTGENVTLRGLDWNQMVPGARLRFEGGVEIEITQYTTPCATIRASFLNGHVNRIKHALHPGWSRVYARVIATGTLREGELVEILNSASQK